MTRTFRLIVLLAALAPGLSSATSAPLESVELTELARRVLATHPSAEAARAEIAAARSELSGSQWARFPGVMVESFADGRRGGDVSASLVLEQPLWSGGLISANIRLSQARLDAAVARLDEVYLDLALRTVQAYVDLLSLRRRVRILEDSLEEHYKLVDSMRRRVEQQVSPAAELRLAESRARQTESEVLQARAAAEVALVQLRELAGDESLEITAQLIFRHEQHSIDRQELVRAALRFDPQRRRIDAEADIASAEVAVRKSDLMPKLAAQYVHRLSDGNDLDDQLGLVVRFQADGGLSRVSAISAARQRERAALLAVQTAGREHRERVMSELARHESALLQVQAGREAALAAQSVTESFLRQFSAGRRTWPEVLNAVREAVTARLIQVEAEASAMSSYLRLMLLSGRWQPGAGESNP